MTGIPLFFDLEASGLHPASYPIEVAWSPPDSAQIESRLIRPDASWGDHWDFNAQDLHGIRRAQLFELGRPCREIAQRMNEQLAGHTIYSDCISWDRFWLLMLFESAEIAPAFAMQDISSILPAPIVTDPLRWNSVMEDAWRQVGGRRHSARDDVAALREAWRRASAMEA